MTVRYQQQERGGEESTHREGKGEAEREGKGGILRCSGSAQQRNTPSSWQKKPKYLPITEGDGWDGKRDEMEEGRRDVGQLRRGKDRESKGDVRKAAERGK